MRIGAPGVLLLAIVLLAGCAAPAPDRPAVDDGARPVSDTASPAELLRRAERAPAREAAELRLRAALGYEAVGDLAGLAYTVEAVDASALDAPGRWRLALLRARLALEAGDPARAAEFVAEVPDARFTSAFDADEYVRITELRAEIHEAGGEPLAAARERVLLDGLLPPAARTANRARIWTALTRLDATEIEAARRAASGEPQLRGWLELARIARDLHPTLEAQQRQVDLWRRRWEDHPAAEALPERLARLPRLIAARPRHVALLLPLSGPLAGPGKAIRDGFVAGQFEAARTGGFAPRLTFFDTASLGATAAYLQAVDSGAELVVGPLAKADVDALAGLAARDVPVLALNGTTDGSAAPGLVQFALLPEAEGRQLAERLWADGVERVLLLVQAEPWAGRIDAAFRERFETLGGTIVQHQGFATTGEVGQAVAAALLVSESEARVRILQRLLGETLEFEPRRRRDVQAVVALADPEHGGTLKPALEYYFAGDLPVYASSRIHDPAAPATGGDSPLAGIRFCDMPWRLLPLDARVRMETAWPDTSGALSIFHAIGVDAWRLHARLGDLRERIGSGPEVLPGVTGDLRIEEDGTVRRELAWAVMAPTGPVPLPRVVAGR